MDAVLLERERIVLTGSAYAELVVWLTPQPQRGSRHRYKYRLALIVEGDCVLRYDNEAGKGDHRHLGSRELGYDFSDLDTLRADFWKDVETWLKQHNAS